MGLDKNLIEQIKANVRISEIISGFVQLVPLGSGKYKGCCPFHKEKTPSFNCNDQEGLFHCFGCNAGGDVIKFLEMIEGSSFKEVLLQLGDKAGITISQSYFNGNTKGNNDEIDRIYHVFDLAQSFYKSSLKNNNDSRDDIAMNYLLNIRHISEEVISAFNMGFAVGKGGLYKFLIEKGCNKNDILKSGLVKEKNGNYLDFFYNRIMIPITNVNQKVIAFGGRVISNHQNGPKYLNSADSIIFKKKDILFNLANARLDRKVSKNSIVIVEGYMDVIAASMIGINTCVAPLGTSITIPQLNMIFKIDHSPILCFNSDSAGRNATLRYAKMCLTMIKPGIVPRFIFPNNAKDIDEFRLLYKNTKDAKVAVSKLFSSAIEIQDFIWNELAEERNIENPNELSKLEQELRSLSNTIVDEDVRSSYKIFFKSKVSKLYQDIYLTRKKQNRKILYNNTNAEPIALFGNKVDIKDAINNGKAIGENDNFRLSQIGILYILLKIPYALSRDLLKQYNAEQGKKGKKGGKCTITIGEASIEIQPQTLNAMLDELEMLDDIIPEMDNDIEQVIYSLSSKVREDIERHDPESRTHLIDIINLYSTNAYNNTWEAFNLDGAMIDELNVYHCKKFITSSRFNAWLQVLFLRPIEQIRSALLAYSIAKLQLEIKIAKQKKMKGYGVQVGILQKELDKLKKSTLIYDEDDLD